MNWNNSVDIMTGCAVVGWGSIPGIGKRFFCTIERLLWFWGPPSLKRVARTLSLGVKRPEGEADHSPPSSAEVENGGAIPVHLDDVLLN
jgi:hypothetical protein